MGKRMLLFLSILVMTSLSCGIASNTGNATQGSNAGSQAAGTPPAIPVSLNAGLASLNSYEMIIKFYSTGPDPSQSTTTTFTSQSSQEQGTYYSDMNTSIIDPGGGEPNTSDNQVYQVGNDQCINGQDGWSWVTNTPQEAEMQGLIKSMIGLTPIIDNPTFVAQETVNGVLTNHFTFTVQGLGAASGTVVNTNQGDYWLAVDGQYIVKYTLVLETSTAAKTDVLHEEFSINVTDINQPVTITLPPDCVQASKLTPTP